ncbi:MAG: ice-binding family protein, partial [Paludibacter sp.]
MKTKSLIFLSALFLLFIPISGFGQTPTFGTVSDFILFTSNGALTSTGTSIVGGGAIGTNLGGITGFNPVSTQQQVQNAATTQCSIDLQTLFNEIHNTPVTQYLTAANLPLSGSYSAGIYSFNSAVTLVTTVALDAQNNPNAVFIFNVVGAFSSAAATKINLVNAAKANNVFFNVDGAISFGAGASMKGNFISLAGAIDMGAGALLEGRALTLAGAISLYENTVMTAFTSAPIVVLTQPGTAQTTGTITITAPTKTGMTYSIDGIHYTNSTGVFTLLQIGKYTVTAKSADGSISAGTTVNILPFLNLGAAACFALFSTNGIITNHGVNTLVTGDIGTQTGTINYSTGNNVGLRYVATSTTLQAATDIALLETNIKKM